MRRHTESAKVAKGNRLIAKRVAVGGGIGATEDGQQRRTLILDQVMGGDLVLGWGIKNHFAAPYPEIFRAKFPNDLF